MVHEHRGRNFCRYSTRFPFFLFFFLKLIIKLKIRFHPQQCNGLLLNQINFNLKERKHTAFNTTIPGMLYLNWKRKVDLCLSMLRARVRSPVHAFFATLLTTELVEDNSPTELIEDESNARSKCTLESVIPVLKPPRTGNARSECPWKSVILVLKPSSFQP